MSSQLSGVLTALATPFASDGQIDEKTLRRLVDRSIDGGVDGVVACGSTGEFAAMSGTERRHLVETVIDQTAGPRPGRRADRCAEHRRSGRTLPARPGRRCVGPDGGRAVLRAPHAR